MPTASGRTAQKQRTREAILDGARQLLGQGQAVTVTDAAEVHGISKATAYRYFSDPAVLVAEAGLAVEVASYEDVVAGASDLRAKLKRITLYFLDLAIEHEEGFRQFIGAAMTSKQPMRRGARRVAMLERAIDESDVKLKPAIRAAIIRALATATGAEAMITLFDIIGADAKSARATVADITDAILDRHLGSG